MPCLRFLRLAPLLGLIAHPALAGGAADTRYMPECRLQALGPSPAPNLADYRGKVLYVDFWASWCGHCGPAFRFLNALEAEFRDAGFAVVGISVDEQVELAQAFLDRHPAGFTVAVDPSGDCPAAFSLTAMPSSFLVDRGGVIRQVHVGFRAGATAARHEEIRRLVAEPPARAGD
jgi:peroxiredoxin